MSRFFVVVVVIFLCYFCVVLKRERKRKQGETKNEMVTFHHHHHKQTHTHTHRAWYCFCPTQNCVGIRRTHRESTELTLWLLHHLVDSPCRWATKTTTTKTCCFSWTEGGGDVQWGEIHYPNEWTTTTATTQKKK